MKRMETLIRTTELGLALVTTYMTTSTLLQASLYAKFRPLFLSILSYGMPIIGQMRELAYFDMFLVALAMILTLLFWRRGDEVGLARLFALNMLMFFPTVIDFSMFNWINLILPYEPTSKVSAIWVLAVGILLQATYLLLRNTLRLRGLRGELIERGAEVEDVDNISKSQMSYLSLLTTGTIAILLSMYFSIPLTKTLLRLRIESLPYPHITIGVACTILIAVATIIYLKGFGPRSTAEKIDEPPLQP